VWIVHGSPERFCLQIFIGEGFALRSQNSTSSWGGRRTLPYAFTAQGVAMLSAVLKSDTAMKGSVQIINTFVAMRLFLSWFAFSKMEISAAEMLKEAGELV
jgi:hypothetical protein